MNSKKDILPIVIASAIALVVTGIVRWLIPGGTVIKQQPLKKELSLPDIPLMIKTEQKKVLEVQVLVTNADIKKDERISLAKLTWKNWPANALQPHFIAKDNKETPLNNRADYNNALNMWARNEIPSGMPLTISMLTSNDPVEVANKIRKQKEEEARKAREKAKKESNFIRVGYRAVTFAVDQRNALSTNMLNPGDLVDVLITDHEGARPKTHVYKAIKLLAIDGMTKIEKDRNKEGGLFGGAMNIGGLLSPKNVTLEIKENMVNIMMKQAGNSGVMISLRSQNEKDDASGEEEEDEGGEEDSNFVKSSLLKGIIEMNKSTSVDILRESRRKKEEEERNLSLLIRNMNELGAKSTSREESTSKDQKNSSNYEIAAGRIVNNPQEEKKKKAKEKAENPVRVYRKLTPKEIQFYKDGTRVSGNASQNEVVVK